MKARLLAGLLGVLMLSSFFGIAPYPKTDSVVKAKSNLSALLVEHDGLSLAYHSETGKVRFLSAPSDQPLERTNRMNPQASVAETARGFLVEYGALFGLQNAQTDLRVLREQNAANRHYVRFQQTYNEIPVFGGELIVQLNQRKQLLSIQGEVLPELNLDTQASISADQALQEALTAMSKYYKINPSHIESTEPELWIYNPALLGAPGLRADRLVWRMELRGDHTTGPFRELVLVNAHLGIIELNFNQISHALDRRICDLDNSVDEAGEPNKQCANNEMAVRLEGQAATSIKDVDMAYDYSGDTYNYFQTRFGRDSLDNKGFKLVSLVNYCPSLALCPYKNAFWNGQQMTYGAGYTADDVVAHELTHGVIEFTANLFYYYQSGAINESIADIFGEFVDLSNNAGEDSDEQRWLITEDLASGALRNMADPTKMNDPDRMKSPLFDADNTFQDRGGVHSNSGVGNKAAYLITDGDTFNGQTIRGIGQAKAEQIYYHVVSYLLTSASDYADLGIALSTSCTALIGSHEIDASDCEQVDKAVLATEMLEPASNAQAPEAEVCTGNYQAQSIFFDNMENTASGNWESQALQGVNMWFYPSYPNEIDYKFAYAKSGTEIIWGYDYGDGYFPVEASDYVMGNKNPISIPKNAFVRFEHAYDFEGSYSLDQYYDGGVFEYSTDNGLTWQDSKNLPSQNGYNGTINGEITDDYNPNPLFKRAAFIGPSKGYISTRYDLSTLEGKQVKFRFRIGIDELTGDYGWFIDDFHVYTCQSTYSLYTLIVRSE